MNDRTWLVAIAMIVALIATLGVSSGQLGTSGCDTVVASGGSIQSAIDAAGVGDVICVETGVYEEALVIPTDELTLTPDEGAIPILEGSSTAGVGILVDEADDVRIEGLHVRGYEGEGIEVDEGASPQIVGNVVESNGGYGIFAEGTPEAVITGNVVALNGQAGGFTDDGIAVHHSAGIHPVDATIAQNTITANGGTGIELFHTDRVVLEENILVGNGGDGIQVDESPAGLVQRNHVAAHGDNGISVNGADIQVQNNTAVGNQRSGIEVWHAERVRVDHNELEANDVGVSFHGDSPDAILRNNSIAGNDGGVQAIDLDAGLVVDARWNWWGAPDGPSGGAEEPETGERADGSGDTVSERVRFDPWWAHHPRLEPGPRAQAPAGPFPV